MNNKTIDRFILNQIKNNPRSEAQLWVDLSYSSPTLRASLSRLRRRRLIKEIDGKYTAVKKAAEPHNFSTPHTVEHNMNIDFKTPVLAKLKELAETNDIIDIRVTLECANDPLHRIYKPISRIYVTAGSGMVEVCYLDPAWPAHASDWAGAAVILGIFDEIVSAVVDATAPTPQQPQA